jgi:short-subunit dehydrogenase
MNLDNQNVFVTGANRGIGEQIVRQLLKRKVNRIYAAARDVNTLPHFGDARVIPMALDITNRPQINTVVKEADDVNILINNAGALAFGSLLSSPYEFIARDLETNYYGLLNMVRGFAPVIEQNGGAIGNVLTLVSLASMAGIGGYSASKAAAYSLTQAIRAELKAKGVPVFGIYPGAVDTEMIAAMEMPKTSPNAVAEAIVSGIDQGTEDIFPDPMAQQLGQLWMSNPKALEQQFAAMAAA